MALNPSPALGIAALLLLAGCPVRTNIGDLAPEARETETPGVLPSTTTAMTLDSSSSGDEASGTEGPTTTIGTIGTSLNPGSSDTGDGEEVEPEMSLLAIRSGDIPEIDVGGTTAQSSGGVSGSSGDLDDDSLYVAVGFFTGTCENPFGDGACQAWRVAFTLDLDEQQPGTYDLALLNGNFYEGDPPQGGECARGNGSLEGSVVIDSIDDDAVQGELQVLDFSPMGVDLTSFSFTAQRC